MNAAASSSAKPANFSDHDDPVRVRIVIEEPQRVNKCRSDNRVAADADARRLADAQSRELAHRFVGQCSAARNDAHMPLQWIFAGIIPILHLPGK